MYHCCHIILCLWRVAPHRRRFKFIFVFGLSAETEFRNTTADKPHSILLRVVCSTLVSNMCMYVTNYQITLRGNSA